VRVLVTGGTGFIGSRLALACLGAGDEVRVTGQARSPVEVETAAELRRHGAQVEIASVTDREQVRNMVRDVELVYHLAAAQHEANVPDAHFHAVNVEGTRNLLEAAVVEGVRRFVHGSTIGVFGWTPGAPVTETSPLAPDNVYGRTKLEGERVVRSYGERLPVTIARISEVYGPGDRRLLKLFRTVKKSVFVLFGDGANLHHPIYGEDLVEAIRHAGQVEAAVGRTYVVAGPGPVSTREMVAAASRALELSPPRLRLPLAPALAAAAVTEGVLRPLGIQPPLHRRRMDFFHKSFAFSGQEAQECLGWKPEVDVEEGMRATVRWYRERGLL